MDNFTEKIYRLYTEHRFVAYLSTASLAIVATGFIWALIALAGIGVASGASRSGAATSFPLILHFNDADGITQVGGYHAIIWFGIFTLIVGALNFTLAIEFDRRDRFFGKFIAGATLFAAVLLFLGVAAIINANV